MIITVGESLIDMLPVDQGGRRLFLPAPGGSPYNVSMALGRLGVPVQFLCRLSEDPFGKLLARTLEESRVDLLLCPRTPALTTLGFVMLDGLNCDPSYVFYTENTAGCALEPRDIPQRLAPEVRCLHFGSFSLAAEPIGSALEKLLSLKTAQVMVSVDPNIRPFLVRSHEEFLPRLQRFLAAADLLKLSEEDLAWMHPGLSVRDCCRQYVALGAGLVVVTCGAKGAVGMNARGRFTRGRRSRTPGRNPRTRSISSILNQPRFLPTDLAIGTAVAERRAVPRRAGPFLTRQGH